MNLQIKDRHLFGAGAAACALCCAAPILAVLGIAGAAAAFATFVFAGVMFGAVVALGAFMAVLNQRRQRARASACAPITEPVPVNISPFPPGDAP